MNASTLLRAIPCSAAILLLVGPSGCASARRPLTVQEVAADVVLENPSDVARWIEYGRVCEFSDNNGGAIQAYEYALELDDSCIPAYEHLGAVYSKVGQLDKANETYRRAFDKGLDSPLLRLGYGYCQAEAGVYDEALKAFSQAFDKSEAAGEGASTVKVSALLGRAGVFRAQGRTEQAEATIAAAAAIDSEVVELLTNESHEQ